MARGSTLLLLRFYLRFRLISCPASRRRFGIWLICSPAGGDNEREHAGAAVTTTSRVVCCCFY
uniref:Uncharacterized protein n=1 Tax=Oryza meridionalis TaxID=40149 RepID=A0A0E0F5N3_9ORYZ